MTTLLIIHLWIFAAWLVLGILGIPYRVNKPRDPLTPGQATASIIVASVLVVVLVLAAIVLAH